eukprot:2013997-Pleurochrysis_carterae.AAC.1
MRAFALHPGMQHCPTHGSLSPCVEERGDELEDLGADREDGAGAVLTDGGGARGKGNAGEGGDA